MEPLAIIAYGIGILPLINNIKREIPDIIHPWYSDDAISLGTSTILETCFYLLTYQVPGKVYHPEPSKSVLIVRLENIEAGKVFGARHGFKLCTGTRYLEGYIRYDESKRDWLRERTLTWDKKISMISKTAGKYIQDSYAAMVHAIP